MGTELLCPANKIMSPTLWKMLCATRSSKQTLQQFVWQKIQRFQGHFTKFVQTLSSEAKVAKSALLHVPLECCQ